MSAHELHATREASDRREFASMVLDSGISLAEFLARVPPEHRAWVATLVADYQATQVVAIEARRRRAMAWVGR